VPGTYSFFFNILKPILNIEMIEAARIDGSSEWNIFNRIIIPTSIPALATIAIGTFIATWNNYLMPTILISDEKLYTMPLVVNMLKTNMYATDIGAIYNGLFLTVIPLIVVYLLLSRYIVGGVSVGGSKE
jgi:multiple sugar transport system permease protein